MFSNMEAFDFAGRTKLPRGPQVGKPWCTYLQIIKVFLHRNTVPVEDFIEVLFVSQKETVWKVRKKKYNISFTFRFFKHYKLTITIGISRQCFREKKTVFFLFLFLFFFCFVFVLFCFVFCFVLFFLQNNRLR